MLFWSCPTFPKKGDTKAAELVQPYKTKMCAACYSLLLWFATKGYWFKITYYAQVHLSGIFVDKVSLYYPI